MAPYPARTWTSAVLSALAVLEGGTEEQKRDWLPRIASGEMRLVPAITERDYGWDERDVRLTAQVDGDSLGLNGSKAYVFDGETASHYLVAVRSEESEDVGLVVVSADAPGVRSRGLPGFAWNLAEVRFDNVSADPTNVLGSSIAVGWSAWQRAVAKAIPVIRRLPGRRLPGRLRGLSRLQPHPHPVRYPHRTIPARAGPGHRTRQPPGRRTLDHLRGPMESWTWAATPPAASAWLKRWQARATTRLATTPTKSTPASAA